MNFLGWYALIGVPVLLLALAWLAVKLSDHDVKQEDKRLGKHKA